MMSMTLLYELQDDLNDVLVAGSNLIGENFKLQKLMPAIEEFGKRVPVFAKVAGLLKQALTSSAETPQLLLETLTLVNSVLTTQAVTGNEGELNEPILCNLSGNELSYQRLERVRTALTERGSGRYEVILEAAEAGTLEDLRLVPALLVALNDSYADNAELAEQALLKYGQALIPILRRKLNLQAGKSEVRKLQLIVQLDQGGLLEFYQQILQDSEEINLKAAALRGLKNYPEALELLMEYSSNPKKALRVAALETLAFQQGEEIDEVLLKGLLGKEAEEIAEACQNYQSIKFVAQVRTAAQNLLLDLLQVGLESEKLRVKQVQLYYLIVALGGRKEPALYQLYQECFRENQVFSSEVASPVEQAAENLLCLDDPEAYQLLIKTYQKLGKGFLKYAFQAALRFKTPDYAYDNFVQFLTGKRQEERKIIVDEFYSYVRWKKEPIELDERWLEPLIKLNQLELVKQAIKPEYQRAMKCLVLKLQEKLGEFEANYHSHLSVYLLLETLMKAEYPGIWKEFLRVLEVIKDNRYGALDGLIELIKELPVSYAEQIEAYAHSNPENLRSGELILVAEAMRANR